MTCKALQRNQAQINMLLQFCNFTVKSKCRDLTVRKLTTAKKCPVEDLKDSGLRNLR